MTVKLLFRGALVVIILCALALVLFLTNDSITIVDVAPRQVSPGEDIVIYGFGFGNQRNGGEVRINGEPLAATEYISWNDRQIVIRAPYTVKNGTLTVERHGLVSNTIPITDIDYVTVYADSVISDAVQVVSHSPSTPSGGDIVRLNGVFSRYRELRLVFISNFAESGEQIRYELADEDILQRSLHSFTIRLPSGIRTGNLHIMMDDDVLESYYFEVNNQIGIMTYHAPRRYAINYGAHLVSAPGARYAVWLPLIPHVPAQPEHDILFISEQFIRAFMDNGYFFIEPQTEKQPISLRIAATVLRAEQRSVINLGGLTPSPDIASYRLERYLVDQPWLAVDSEQAQREVDSVIDIPNFYLRARAIYQRILARLAPQANSINIPYISSSPTGTGDSDSVSPSLINDNDSIHFQRVERLLDEISASEEVVATAAEYALLADTLLRTAGIPSRIVTGVYLDRDRSENRRIVPHYWNEFFLPNFGWVPMDIAMGDEMYTNSLPQDSEASSFYFGSIDAQRIAISRNIQILPRYQSEGLVYSFARSYLFFTHNIEAEGEVDETEFYLYPVTMIEQ